MNDLTLDVGLAYKLKGAFGRNGWTAKDIDALCQGDILGQLRQVQLGDAAIAKVDHFIDCDTNPPEHGFWKIVENVKGGLFKWDPSQIELCLINDKETGRIVSDDELREKNVLNSAVLEFLWSKKRHIPAEWKERDERGNVRVIYFWGTQYIEEIGRAPHTPFVRGLYWRGNGFEWDMCKHTLEFALKNQSYVALHAS